MRITAVIGAAALLLAAVRPALAQTADNLKPRRRTTSKGSP